MTRIFAILGAFGALAACSAEPRAPQVSRSLILPEGTTCIEPMEERNAWLRAERPALREVAAAYHRRGLATQESRVYRAYKAWHDAGFDHQKAAGFYGPDYLSAAACWA